MQNTRIEIRYSLANNAPSSLNIAEPAYSYASNTLFIGTPDDAGAIAIGGKYYLDVLNSAFSKANTSSGGDAYDQANAAYDQANAAYAQANVANDDAAFANTVAIAAFDTANSGAGSAGAFDQANAAYDYANTVYTYSSNTVMLVANGAYDKANAANLLAYAALPQTGGTVSGDLAVSGNVTISGNVTYANTESLLIGDNIIELNADIPHTVAPTEDAGIQVNRGSADANTSVLWNETADEWQFTNDASTFYAIPTNTAVETAQTKGEAAHLTANATYTYAANDVMLVANSAYAKANAANINADFANTVAIAAFDTANSGAGSSGAYDQANAAYDYANTVYTYAANDVMLVANSAYDKANSANITADSADTQSQAAFDQANAVWDSANSVYTYAANDVMLTANSAYGRANVVNVGNSGTTVQFQQRGSQKVLNFVEGTDIVINVDQDDSLETVNVLITSTATAGASASDAFNKANLAYTIAANQVQLIANSAYAEANVTMNVGNTTAGVWTPRSKRRALNFLEGSGITITIDDDAVLNTANVTITATGGDTTIAEAAFDQANTVWDSANSNYTFSANTVRLIANAAYGAANSNYTFSANTVRLIANTAYDAANSNYTYAANNVMLVANTAFNKANSANVLAYKANQNAIAAFVSSNSVYTFAANTVRLIANSAYGKANTTYTYAANNVRLIANTAYNKANSANVLAYKANQNAIAAFVSSNSVYTFAANTVRLIANTAYDKANSANLLAFAALPQSGGTIDGDLEVTGNVTISGNITYANTETLLIGDNIIELNSDLPSVTAPTEDAGIKVNRGSSSNVFLLWDEGSDVWQWSDDNEIYWTIPSNTDVETAQTKGEAAHLSANTAYTYAANDVMLAANSAYGTANIANLMPVANTMSNGYATVRSTRHIMNFLEGTNITITVDDDSAGDRANVTITSTGGTTAITTSDTAPSSPNDGDLWWHTIIGKLLVYYDDGDTQQWVETAPGLVSANGSGGGVGDTTIAVAAFVQANTVWDSANGNYTFAANTVRLIANTAYDAANSNYTYAANDVMLVANSAYDKANAANITADVADAQSQAAFDRANSVWDSANSNYTFSANTVRLIANSAYDAGNTNYTFAANTVRLIANTAYDAANSNYTYAANNVMSVANSAYGEVNVAMNVGITTAGTFTPTSKRRALNFIEGSNITITIDDDADLNTANITITSTASGGDAGPAFDQANAAYTFAANDAMLAANSAYGEANVVNVGITTAGTFTPTSKRSAINFIEGAGVTIAIVDDPALNTANVTITATGGDTTIAEAAFDQANTVWDSANSNYTFAANTVRMIANSAFDKANSVFTYAANDVMLVANTAYDAGNTNYTFAANTVRLIANTAYDAANSNYTYAANNVMIAANSAFAMANAANLIPVGNTISSNSYYTNRATRRGINFLEGSGITINVDDDPAINVSNVTITSTGGDTTIAEAAFDQANTVWDSANSNYTFAANTVSLIGNSAFDQANTVWDSANSNYTFAANTVRLIANTAYDAGNTNYTYAANNVMLVANSAYAAGNSNYTYAANNVMIAANSAYAAGNSNYTYAANNVMIAANSAYVQANIANTLANTRTVNFIIDGGGSELSTGSKGGVIIDRPFNIDQWTLLADQSGSVVVDVQTATYSDFPTNISSMVGGGTKPTLSTAQKNQSAPASWTSTTGASGNVVVFNVDSVTTVTRVTVSLKLTIS